MKSHASNSKLRIIFIILLTVIILTGSTAAILSFIAANQYWNRSHLQDAVLNIKEYDGDVIQNDSDLDEIKNVVHKCNEEAVPIREELSPFFEDCNEMIIDCFRDIYGVDTSEKLDALRVMESAYPENISQMVGGSHSGSFPNKLFLNKAVLDAFTSDLADGEPLNAAGTGFSAKMLRTVYIHEVMHYLGFNSDSGFDHFTEAVAECLNKKVTVHSGIKYESITGYASIQGFAAQIVECDPEFVRGVLTEDNFNMSRYFNDRLRDQTDTDYAEYYDRLIGLIQKGDHEDLDRIVYYTQYLTYEYCKAADKNARDILKSCRENNVNFFELKWMFHIYM